MYVFMECASKREVVKWNFRSAKSSSPKRVEVSRECKNIRQ